MTSRQTQRLAVLSIMFLTCLGHSATLQETFTTRTLFAAGTAIWNQALGTVHPTLQVMNYEPGFTPLTVDVGDGSHGTFDISTYARFSVGGDISGNKIRFDTSTYPILKVTSFRLAPGWILEPVGDNPLVIYSLSDVTIEGEIWCHGDNGGNAVNTVAGTGGRGRCGGGDGGNGAAVGAPSGDDGENTHASVTGGIGGHLNGATAVCGGGGGSWNTTSPSTAGDNSASGGGDAGASFADPEFDIVAGGAGGGGGAASTASGGVAGAGGGGGGGAVIIHTVRNFALGASPSSLIGSINVNGGSGGNSNVEGGAGGGGGGGSVLVFAGGTVHIYNTDAAGASQANFGAGGTNLSGDNGGAGGSGRSWFVGNVYDGVGIYTPAEQAPVDPALAIVQYNPASQYVESQSIDLANHFAQLNSLTLSPLSTDFQFQVAGSTDNFISDDTGFTSDLNLVAKKRYLKFRITIATTDVNTPTTVDTATIDYTPGEREKFTLKAAGCGRVDTTAPAPASTLFLLSLIFAFLITLKFKARRQKCIHT